MSFHVPERKRETDVTLYGRYASTTCDGNNGLFHFNFGAGTIRVIASDGGGFDHVSVSLKHRCPSWEEMCRIKDIFWDGEDVVMQLHPKKSEYVTVHQFCLHLWRPNDGREIPTPHYGAVGNLKGQSVEAATRDFLEKVG